MIAVFALAMQANDSVRLHNAVDRTLFGIEQMEARPMSREIAMQRARAGRRLTALLDTIALQRSWGRNELYSLRRRYPGSQLLVDYDARLAEKQQRWNDAIELREGMLRATPSDTAVQRAYAEALEHAGRSDDAKRAYLRWFETAPTNDAPFRALLRLNPDYADLLERVQRMQVRLPDAKILRDHEIELLYKLGRKP